MLPYVARMILPLAIWQGEETLETVRETERDREGSGSALLHLVVSLGLLPHLLDWFCNFIRALDKQPNSKAPLKILWIWLPCLCLSINLDEVWLGEKPKKPSLHCVSLLAWDNFFLPPRGTFVIKLISLSHLLTPRELAPTLVWHLNYNHCWSEFHKMCNLTNR